MKILLSSLMVFLLASNSQDVRAFEVVADPAAAELGERCPLWGSTRMLVVSDAALIGDKSCINSIQEGQTGGGSWGGIIRLPARLHRGDEIWIRATVFFPEDFNYDSTSRGSRLKFLRLRTADADGTHRGYNDLYINPEGSASPFSFIYEGEQRWSHFSSSGDAIRRGEWEVYEIYIRLDDVAANDGGQAHVRVWKNGHPIGDIKSRVTLASAGGYAHSFYLFTYWNGGSPQSQSMYIDKFVMTSDTPASRDSDGFPFIGVDGLDLPIRLNPPENVRAE